MNIFSPCMKNMSFKSKECLDALNMVNLKECISMQQLSDPNLFDAKTKQDPQCRPIFENSNDTITFTIPKTSHIPINQIYNVLKLNMYIKNVKNIMEKTAHGIQIKINRNDIFAFFIAFNNQTDNFNHGNMLKQQYLCTIENRIFFEPFESEILGSGFQYVKEIDTDILKLFQMFKAHKQQLKNILEKYDTICIFGEYKTFLLCSKICNQKIAYQKFTEIYYRSYAIEIETLVSCEKIYKNIEPCNIIVACDGEKLTIVGQHEDLKEFCKKNPTLGENKISSNFLSVFTVDSETSGFLCGKKFGKINKITKQTETEITVTNDIMGHYTYTLKHANIFNMLEAIEMLNLEYPRFHLFSLDFKHHKKIIGTSGKHIQRIMKKYDVYVKFMNEKEAQFYPENVICKTPQKNKKNLKLIQEEIVIDEKLYKPEEMSKFTLQTDLPKIYDLLNNR